MGAAVRENLGVESSPVVVKLSTDLDPPRRATGHSGGQRARPLTGTRDAARSVMAPSTSRSRARLAALVLAGATFTVATAPYPGGARAEVGSATAEPSSPLKQEWIGVELTPFAIPLTGAPCCDRETSLYPVQVGLGGTLRLLRHRWEHAYVIPIEGGFYRSTASSPTTYLHVQAEGGLVVPGTNRRLEMGLGVGAGILGITYASGCDGSCAIGGAGALATLVARYIFVDRSHFTVGANVRAVLPLNQTRGEWFGHLMAWGDVLLVGVELGVGS